MAAAQEWYANSQIVPQFFTTVFVTKSVSTYATEKKIWKFLMSWVLKIKFKNAFIFIYTERMRIFPILLSLSYVPCSSYSISLTPSHQSESCVFAYFSL